MLCNSEKNRKSRWQSFCLQTVLTIVYNGMDISRHFFSTTLPSMRDKLIEADTKWPPVGKLHFNSSDAGDGIFQICGLTHWGRVTQICVSKLTIIGSDNGLSPGRRQAIIWNNAGLLLIEPLGTNFSEISIVIQTFSFKKMHLNMSSAKWRPFCLGLNVLIPCLLLL